MIIMIEVSKSDGLPALLAESEFARLVKERLLMDLLSTSRAEIFFEFVDNKRIKSSEMPDFLLKVSGVPSATESIARAIATSCKDCIKSREATRTITCIVESETGERVSATVMIPTRPPEEALELNELEMEIRASLT